MPREYYLKNRDKILQAVKEWRGRNPDMIRLIKK